ncbi:class I SAM-dependent methyltransferase [Ahrensia sp. R2A130]|uniref:class I SAM-dependent methyltransferase n=1 Tax=Ahrensia sp. R2A130 TaxID=744979 RepID=UPI0001E09C98|nr:methyltransferase [Ahrensia sp. R2A130]EFL88397.1 methyltransferase small [Ahrensia sp. R2A130]
MADARDTLLLPFDQDLLPQPDGDWLFLEAQPLPGGALPEVLCEQGHRGFYLALEQAGYNTAAERDEISRAGALVLANRNRIANERNLARAWNATREGGVVAFAGDTNSSVKALRKWAGRRTEVAGSLSKHHAVVFWLIKSGDDWPLAEAPAVNHEFHVAPGMFSARDIDKGSALLAEQFVGKLHGRVADFGAGWGYLSAKALEVSVEHIELYEADHAALEAAKINAPGAASFSWCDITSEAPLRSNGGGTFDTIIMNPPFHTSRAAEPALGQTFIEAASKALPQGGRLLMVANSRLPYEAVLTKHFRRFSALTHRDGFKVLEAVR